MSLFDRVLLFLFVLVGTVLAAGSGALTSGWQPAFSVLNRMLATASYSDGVTIFLGLMVLAGLRLLWAYAGLGSEPQSVVLDGSLGEVRIALAAIADSVERQVTSLAGVRDVKAHLHRAHGGIGIKLRLSLSPEVSGPALSTRVQDEVSEHVLRVAGVKVTEVRVLVGSLTAKKPRVE
ncbi:MAG TPA: alkaline shock response membrane anchor protein AmaP [Spirochaetia bacterium]|nr:alkaline shock response membrane anchor protein AmaP [Spirochaetia bacterium]